MSATERLLAMLDDGRMSRTDLDPATLAASLRRMVGDGSVEWVTEPMQTRVLLDVADMLDENAKLREERDMYRDLVGCMVHPDIPDQLQAENAKLRELCAGLWTVMWACAEQRCPHRHEDCFVVSGNGGGPKSHGECWYKQRMRELGMSAG